MAASPCLMPEPVAPSSHDPATAAHVLVQAQPAGANMFDLRADRPSGNAHLAASSAASGVGAVIHVPDTATVLSHMAATCLPAGGARAHPGS
jgi:hypothetical protein